MARFRFARFFRNCKRPGIGSNLRFFKTLTSIYWCAFTPNSYRSKLHSEHSSPKRQPPVVTPPYNLSQLKAHCYGHGNVSLLMLHHQPPPPPPLWGPLPQMPSNVVAYYQPHHHPTLIIIRVTLTLTTIPVISMGTPLMLPMHTLHVDIIHHGYNNYYPPREEHNHSPPPPPPVYVLGPKPPPGAWNYDSSAPAGYNLMERSQPSKTNEEDEQPQADHPKSSEDRRPQFEVQSSYPKDIILHR
eukprot:scaffold103_cov47-Cyclotella_meneghiniana.AAC.1